MARKFMKIIFGILGTVLVVIPLLLAIMTKWILDNKIPKNEVIYAENLQQIRKLMRKCEGTLHIRVHSKDSYTIYCKK